MRRQRIEADFFKVMHGVDECAGESMEARERLLKLTAMYGEKHSY